MAVIQLVPVEPEYIKLVTDRIDQFVADKDLMFLVNLINEEPVSKVLDDDSILVVAGEFIPLRALMKNYQHQENLKFFDNCPTQVIGRCWCVFIQDQRGRNEPQSLAD